jgi:hypothetical protein
LGADAALGGPRCGCAGGGAGAFLGLRSCSMLEMRPVQARAVSAVRRANDSFAVALTPPSSLDFTIAPLVARKQKKPAARARQRRVSDTAAPRQRKRGTRALKF